MNSNINWINSLINQYASKGLEIIKSIIYKNANKKNEENHVNKNADKENEEFHNEENEENKENNAWKKYLEFNNIYYEKINFIISKNDNNEELNEEENEIWTKYQVLANKHREFVKIICSRSRADIINYLTTKNANVN